MDSGFRRTLVVLGILLALMATSAAQIITGQIVGVVTDQSGAVVPSANITVTDLAQNKTYSAVSSSDGAFAVANLPYGFYKVSVKARGFSELVSNNVQVNAGQTAQIDARLKVAATGTEVVVSDTQQRVQTDTSEIKTSIDRRQILDMPLPTRNPLDLVRGMPGTTMTGSDLVVHGLRPNTVNLMQDGVNVSDNYVKTSGFFSLIGATVDSVGEFTITSSAAGTDSGFGSTQANIVTTRGTNNYHGSVYWFNRTNYLNANTYLNGLTLTPTPFLLQNRIGYQIGGPLSIPKLYNGKNRTYFFNNFEVFRQPVQQNTNRLILSDAARTGLFTYTRQDTGATAQVNLLTGAGMNNRGTIGNTGQTPVINSQVMNYYNSIVPSANNDNCSGADRLNLRCFTWNVPGSNKSNRYVARIDQNIGQNHVASFVYNELRTNTLSDFLNGDFTFFPKAKDAGQGGIRELFSWSLRSNFGSNKTNNATFGIQRSPVDFFIQEDYSGTGGFQLFTPGNLSNVSLGFNNLPQGRNTPVWEGSDNFSIVHGNHNMTMGGDYRRVKASNYLFNSVIPIVSLGSNSANPDGLTANSFPGVTNATAFQQSLSNAQNVFDTVTGLLSSVQQGFNHTSATSGFVAGKPRIVDPNQHNFAFYFTDTWKARSNFTVNLGLRWEYQGVFDSMSGLILQPNDRLQGVFGAAPVGDALTPVTTPAATDVLFNLAGGHNNKPLYNRDWNNFAPTVGFAWDPFNDGKTAVRGGFAIHYTNDGFTLYAPAATSNPGLFTTVLNSTPAGVFNASSVPTPNVPADVFPISAANNFGSGPNSGLISDAIFANNLATPYVEEWNAAIQREIGKQFTVEMRYVGNHGVKLYRTTNYNEIDLLNNPFTASAANGGGSVANVLSEFQNAQANLLICQANAAACRAAQGAQGVAAASQSANNFGFWGLPGQVKLPILNTLFKGFSGGSASGFASSTFVSNLVQNQIGSMFNTLRTSPTYITNRLAGFPLNFFVPNPWVNNSNLTDNSSWSDYNGLEAIIRRRFSTGLYVQGNYTYSKTLGDQRFTSNQTEAQPYLSLANRAADKARAPFDATHNIAGSVLYPLPFGRGQMFGSGANTLLNTLISGWNVQGDANWSTGLPYTILSGRNTTGVLLPANSGISTENAVLRNMTIDQLKSQLGVFKIPGAVLYINPNSGLIKVTSTTNPTTGVVSVTSTAVMCTPGQTTPCWDHPAAGQYGNLPFQGINGPGFFNSDASVIKRFPVPAISEQFLVELRFEAFDLFNHSNFSIPSSTSGAVISSTQFGRLTSQVDTARGGGATNRQIQWGLRVTF